MRSVCVIGGGLTGLVRAWREDRADKRVTVLEKNDFPGGVLRSERTDGYLIEHGANSLSLRSREVAQVLEDLNLLDRAVDANKQANLRYIVRKDRLVSLPMGPKSFLLGKFLSPLGKARLLMEPFISKGRNPDESVGAFIRRRLGREALDYLGNPFLAGVYAARPESLLLKHAFPALQAMERENGSLFGGIRKAKENPDRLPQSRLLSFPNGLQEMTDRLAKFLPEGAVQCSRSVKRIERSGDQWLVSSTDRDGNTKDNLFDEVACSLPAHALQSIEWTGLNEAHDLAPLADATHHPLSVVYLGYDSNLVKRPLDGFGFLVPEGEKRRILGALFSSSIFPERAPAGKALLTIFVGGERQPDLARLGDDVLYDLAMTEASGLLGITGEPEFQRIVRWPRAIPLPDGKTDERIRAAQNLSSSNPGLSFTGSHLCGPPLPSCLLAQT